MLARFLMDLSSALGFWAPPSVPFDRPRLVVRTLGLQKIRPGPPEQQVECMPSFVTSIDMAQTLCSFMFLYVPLCSLAHGASPGERYPMLVNIGMARARQISVAGRYQCCNHKGVEP